MNLVVARAGFEAVPEADVLIREASGLADRQGRAALGPQ